MRGCVGSKSASFEVPKLFNKEVLDSVIQVSNIYNWYL